MQSRRKSRTLTVIVFVLRPVLMLLTRRDWRVAAPLPEGGFVIAANHVSHLDPLAFAHFMVDHDIPPRYLAKASIVNLPVLGHPIRATEQIPVYRGSANAGEAFAAAVAAVEAGGCVIIYPEGTITRDPDLWPMSGKSGAARVALATGCPVIPAAQWGPNDVLAPYDNRLRLFPRKTMHVSSGPPVDLDDLLGKPLTTAVLTEATTRIMDDITDLLAEIRGLPAPAERLSLKDARAMQKPLGRKARKKNNRKGS